MGGASGALVVSVDDNGPAKQAGIKSGDIILTFNGAKIDTMRELPRAVAETKVGTRAEVEIWRKDKSIKKYVIIERLNEGGIVSQLANAIDIECLPTGVPDSIDVDITNLELNGTVFASDINLPDDTCLLYTSDAADE